MRPRFLLPIGWVIATTVLWGVAYEILTVCYSVGNADVFGTLQEQHRATALVATIMTSISEVVWLTGLPYSRTRAVLSYLLREFLGTTLLLAVYVVFYLFSSDPEWYPKLFFSDIEFLSFLVEVTPIFAFCAALTALTTRALVLHTFPKPEQDFEAN